MRRGCESLICFSWRAKGDSSALLGHLMGGHRDVISEGRRGDTHIVAGKVPLKSKEKNPCNDGGQTLEQAFRTVVGSSSLEILGLNGQNPKHLDLSMV